ncbi:hypothetical protein F1847_03930 [Thermodesulfobacterium sp. TA1]|uniref:methyl-accepting chemotaxis protein n=1 Tax=Thermodesulfobacterium sp. TA1 TaxID=2234087 RepID=UPI001232BB15|nr:methyl-accepting chemotaxis protein [Thermodesulfobacterium sp. TA1]QER41933.1 hypothetical protein F1847_03930 [Thermodesulfobacterium sp. TA1]
MFKFFKQENKKIDSSSFSSPYPKNVKKIAQKLWKFSYIKSLSNYVSNALIKALQLSQESGKYISYLVERFNFAINTLSEKILPIKNETDNLVKKSEESKKKINVMIEEVKVIESSLKSFVETSQKMQTSFQEIKNSLTEIHNIAEQTTILSLNASIEAARVGLAGKGFTVLAEEIRKLANKTNQFAKHINESILSVEKNINFFTNSIFTLKENLDKNIKTLNELYTFVESNYKMAENVEHLINDMFLAIEDQAKITEEITQNMLNLSKNLEITEKQLKSIVIQFKKI